MVGLSAHENLCMPSKIVVSVSPSPVMLLHSNPIGLQSLMLWGSFSQCQTLRLGSLTWGSGLSHLWENLCDIIIFQFMGLPPLGMGFDYIEKAPLLPSHCSFFFVFGCKISFLVGTTSFLINSCLAVGSDFDVFMRGVVLKSYSVILSSISCLVNS